MTRIYRSQRDKKFLGVCGGLAETIQVDSTILRIIVIITAFFTGGTTLLIYIIAGFLMPKNPHEPPHSYPYRQTYNQHQYPPYGGGHGGFGSDPGSSFGREPERQSASPNLDEMMKDIEKKAMKKEIEELRAKLAKYEKGEE